jgi:hypothetical protein
MLLSGLCDTPTPRDFRMAMSESFTHTPCAARTPGPSTPRLSRYVTGVLLERSRAVCVSELVSAT